MKNSIIAADELHQTHDTVTPTFSHLCLKPVIRDGLILETCDYYTTRSFHICLKPVIPDGLILETCDYYTTHSFHICVSSQSCVEVPCEVVMLNILIISAHNLPRPRPKPVALHGLTCAPFFKRVIILQPTSPCLRLEQVVRRT